MITKIPLENLLGPDYKLVILDTFVLRQLLHAGPNIPPWHKAFVAAKDKGYSFSLSGYAALEILNFLQRTELDEQEKARGFELAEQFLEKKLPICLEGKSLTFLAGIRGEPDDTSEKESDFSKNLWNHLKTQKSFPDAQKILERTNAEKQEHQAMLQRLKQFKDENPGLSKHDVRKRVKEYKSLLAQSIMQKGRLPETHKSAADALAEMMAHHFETILQNESYNPEKRLNDGIDKLLFLGLLLPSSYVITEERWMKLAKEKGSSSWNKRVLSPEEFADSFGNGSLSLEANVTG